MIFRHTSIKVIGYVGLENNVVAICILWRIKIAVLYI